MTKTLEQIQEENRKAIIMACYPKAKSYEELSKTSLFNKPLTLDNVLFALGSDYAIAGNGLILKYDPYRKHFKAAKVHGVIEIEDRVAVQYPIKLDLTELTLEDQTEEAQRAVNELLGER